VQPGQHRIYSVLLERDEDFDAHAIAIGVVPGGAVSFWAITLRIVWIFLIYYRIIPSKFYKHKSRRW
jgi:hypothetical protein